MISGDLRNVGGKIEIETNISQSNENKDKKIIVQNLSWRIFFQEQVKFLNQIWYQFGISFT